MLWVSTGCVNETGIIRAQNFDGVQTADGIYQPGYHIQQMSGYSDPYVSQPCQSCGANGCNTCLYENSSYNPDWYPTHHHWYRYKPPKNLVYPPANQPGGVVVYPYYTLKGPDDFFFKG